MRRLSISHVLLLVYFMLAQTDVAEDSIHEIAGKNKSGIAEIAASDSSGDLKTAPTRIFTSPDGLIRKNRWLIQLTAPISHLPSESPVTSENWPVTRVATPRRIEGQNLDFSMSVDEVSAEVMESPSEQVADPDPEPSSLALDAEAYLDSGTGLLRKKEYWPAIKAFSKAIQLAPNYAAPYFSRALAYYDLAEFERAINDYSEVIRIDGNRAQTHDDRQLASDYYNRGLAYYRQGAFEKAISDFSEVILLDPNDAHAFYNRGGAYYRRRQFDKAISDYNEVIRLGRDNAETYYNLGLAYSKQRKFKEAISNYSAAIRLNPNHAKAYKNRALAYLRVGNSENADADFTMARRLEVGR